MLSQWIVNRRMLPAARGEQHSESQLRERMSLELPPAAGT